MADPPSRMRGVITWNPFVPSRTRGPTRIVCALSHRPSAMNFLYVKSDSVEVLAVLSILEPLAKLGLLNALYEIWQHSWFTVQLLLKLINEIDFPFETLDLPCPQREGEYRHYPKEDHRWRQSRRSLRLKHLLFREPSTTLMKLCTPRLRECISGEIARSR